MGRVCRQDFDGPAAAGRRLARRLRSVNASSACRSARINPLRDEVRSLMVSTPGITDRVTSRMARSPCTPVVTHAPTPENRPIGQSPPGDNSPALQVLRVRSILTRVDSELRSEHPRNLSGKGEDRMELPKAS